MRVWFALLALAALVVACGVQQTWVTPKGQVFQSATCDTHELTPGGGPDTCLWRKIDTSEVEQAKCKADGGNVYVSASASYPIFPGSHIYEAGCIFPYADVGKACSKSTDCRGACDAETRTCRQSELGGDMLDENGRVTGGYIE
ncbi:hypothetical protein [Stagnihabitans tardus]|uniref:Lipoprotein n=1 Tax=Stagnihabitans tardus TaxID=2699202 RepID=A0AAE4Y8J7_9RHOB|nr:hypothetical protein [Stagnihabitans tardus]NBZ86921.1 hypothetical protein [Stagnihabitans tardus]